MSSSKMKIGTMWRTDHTISVVDFKSDDDVRDYYSFLAPRVIQDLGLKHNYFYIRTGEFLMHTGKFHCGEQDFKLIWKFLWKDHMIYLNGRAMTGVLIPCQI